MAKEKSGLRRLFSKSNKDCCSIEIEEVKANGSDCCDATEQKRDKKQKEA